MYMKIQCGINNPIYHTMAGLDKICAKIPEVCFWHGFDIFTYQWP